ncbi:MAG TPA: endonuclease/exonuclease/phosphatase family protein [Ornithinicoccus sp.]|nr:endonuclease/exonuclease/phosphatase family protein [Ornithinicoccus sp.]
MRLVTWNIYHGRSPGDGVVDPGRLAAALSSLDADVVALQEVDRGQPRSHWLDITALAAEAMSAPAWRFVPTVIGDPAGRWRPATDTDLDADRDAYGIGLVSRWPVLRWHLLRMSAAPALRAPVLIPGSRQLLWLRDEPRAALAATLQTPDGPVTVASTHLSFMPGINVLQLVRLRRWLRALPGPRVLLADLNLPGAIVARLWGQPPLVRVRNYPLSRPLVQVDHIVGDGELPPVQHAETRQLAVSDHAAVLVDLGRGALGRPSTKAGRLPEP